MRYFVRAAKYFVAFCVLYLGIVWLSVMTTKSMDYSVWDYVAATFATTRGKMLGLAVVVLSALYPRMGFMTRQVQCDMTEERDFILSIFVGWQMVNWIMILTCCIVLELKDFLQKQFKEKLFISHKIN